MSEANRPVLVLLSGYSGSGKTSVIKELAKKYSYEFIITDQIRQSLIDQGQDPFDEKGSGLTRKIRTDLIAKTDKSNLVIEGNFDQQGILELKAQMAKTYKVFAVFLKADEDILESRVQKRQPESGMYQGDIEGLRQTLKRDWDWDSYDLVLDTSKLSPVEVAKRIVEKVNY